MRRSEQRVRVTRVSEDRDRQQRADVLAVEEPLEMRVNGSRLAVTMRTPQDDFSLAVGFLLSEGIISSPEQIVSVRYCQRDFGPGADNADNTVDVVLTSDTPVPDATVQRQQIVNSSCGICGRHSIEQVETTSCFHGVQDTVRIPESTVMTLPDLLRTHQRVFDKTGGIHAAGLYNTRTGEMDAVREDVGRHNAVDKVLGWALLEGMLPLADYVLVVSSRASFELVQKAVMAGIPMLVAVSAPTSLAVDLARQMGMTLCGFTRSTRTVIYSGGQRVLEEPTEKAVNTAQSALETTGVAQNN